MSKAYTGIPKSNSKMQCPLCNRSIIRTAGTYLEAELAPKAGDVTDCDHCHALLEYRSDGDRLTLVRTSKARAAMFNQLGRERRLNIPDMIAYVTKYRSMPPQYPMPIQKSRSESSY